MLMLNPIPAFGEQVLRFPHQFWYSARRTWTAEARRSSRLRTRSRYWRVDTVSSETVVESELDYRLRLAVEAKVLTANATSGIQLQPYATSVLATLRKGLTKLETSGYAAGAVVLHPTDWERVELALSSTNAVEHLSLPYDRLRGACSVCPWWPPSARPQAWAMCWPSTRWSSTPTPSAWACSGRRRPTPTTSPRTWSVRGCEGRFGTSVLSPLGVVSCDPPA
jgi:hypothetical protein